ncbi:MAG: DeoR/GlpR family DNA-binding transcription regulator [Solirubrobacteraceae bacterium]
MTTEGRRRGVQALLAEQGEVSIGPLADRFGVSEMTIRRDLETLEADGLARRVRGGAISTVARGYEPPFATRVATAHPGKLAIAQAAATLVQDGETAILDVGTTVLELARALRGRTGLTVVTPSMLAALELANEPYVRVLLTGGSVRPGELSLVGDFAEQTLRALNCDVFFMGVGGLDVEKGLTEYNLDDARVKRAALQSSGRCVVLADRRKLGCVCLATIAPLSTIDVLITDADENHPAVSAAREGGTETICVQPTEEADEQLA